MRYLASWHIIGAVCDKCGRFGRQNSKHRNLGLADKLSDWEFVAMLVSGQGFVVDGFHAELTLGADCDVRCCPETEKCSFGTFHGRILFSQCNAHASGLRDLWVASRRLVAGQN